MEETEENKKEIPIKEKVDELWNLANKKKNKELRIGKAKIKGSRLKKGWIGVLKVSENGNGEFTKSQIEGSVFDFNKNNYHATDKSEIIMIKGKYPLIIQPTWKTNPIKVVKDNEINETYGQEYIIAKLLKDVIKVKKPVGNGMIMIVVIIGVLFVLGKYVFKLF